MNMKKTCKRFWRLGRGAEGFTLVELIVVIAILAILAGVAVPVYSTYVEQANKQADITLVSEVADALTLYYYSHSDTPSGFVVLTKEGEVCAWDSNGVGKAAMDAAFGEGWENNLSLKYDGWAFDSASAAALMSIGNAEIINNSAFAGVSTETLLNDVQNVVTAASEFLTKQTSEDKLDLVKKSVGGELKYNALCEELGVDPDNMTDAELSNLLVFAVASGAMESNGDTSKMTVVEQAATNYSAYVAYAYANPDDETVQKAFQDMSDALNSATTTNQINAAFDAFKTACGEGWTNYEKTTEDTENRSAFTSIMQSVDFLQSSLADGDLTDADYFLNSGVGDQLDTYLAALKTVNNYTDADMAAIENAFAGGVIIFLYSGPRLDCSSIEAFAQ